MRPEDLKEGGGGGGQQVQVWEILRGRVNWCASVSKMLTCSLRSNISVQ